MSDEKNKMSDKASEIAKNIWLAGVGAYGRAVDEAQGRLEKAGVESPKLFRDLVKAGAALEDEAREAMQAGQQARHSVEERINRVRDNFNLQRPVRGEDLVALHQKIDQLSNKIDAMSAALAASGAVKTPRKKVPAAKKKVAASRSAAPRRAAKSATAKPGKTTRASAKRRS